MNAIVKKLVEKLAILLLPRLVKQLVKALEEVIKVDLDGDGKVGLSGDATGRTKTTPLI